MTTLEDNIISGQRCTAFVGSGGGTKGLAFHIGVCRYLEEKGFNFNGGVSHWSRTELREPGEPGNKNIDKLFGSSGGALVCAGLASGYSPDEMLNVFMIDKKLKEAGLKRGFHHYLSLNTQALTELAKSIRRTIKNGWDPEAFSIMSPVYLGRLEKRLHKFLATEDFRFLETDLFVVTTPLNSTGRIVYCRKPKQQDGRVIYRNDANISSTVAASCSLQCFHPYNVQHHKGEQIDLVDGETRKTLSYRLAADNGADLVFVSYTHVPYSFNDVTGSIKKYGMVRTAIQSIYLMIEEKILASQEAEKSKNKTLEIITDEFEKIIKEVPEHKKELENCKGRITGRLVNEQGYRPDVKYIFIAPDEDDDEFFFTWHLGMSQEYIKKISDKGYLAAKKALEKYEFR